jgi:cobalamin biosynthesis protein CobD/CbiB
MAIRRKFQSDAGGSPLGENGWIAVLVVMTVLDIIWFLIWWPYWFFVLAGIVWEVFAVAICLAGIKEAREG